MGRGRLSLWLVNFLLLGVPILLALGGYLYALDRGVLMIDVQEVGTPGETALHLPVKLENAAGEVVAAGRIAGNLVLLDYPALEPCTVAGSEHPDCRMARARWVDHLVPDIAAITFGTTGCRFDSIPLALYPDREIALTWWIPHPRFGGTPLTRWREELQVDLRQCRVVEGF